MTDTGRCLYCSFTLYCDVRKKKYFTNSRLVSSKILLSVHSDFAVVNIIVAILETTLSDNI